MSKIPVPSHPIPYCHVNISVGFPTFWFVSESTKTQKSMYELAAYGSTTERDLPDRLEKNEAIKLYAKLPGWFKVPTPLGIYIPDWVVLMEEDGAQRLYFVAETKSSSFTDDLRDKESAKIECDKAYFSALAVGENTLRYVAAHSVDDLLIEVAKG